MARKSTTIFENGNLTKLILGLGAVGGIGVGGTAYSKSAGADERTAILITKVERLEKDRDDLTKQLGRVDKRTVRIEEQLKAIGAKMGVKQYRDDD